MALDLINGHQVGDFNGKVVTIKEYKGKVYVDIRKWFTDKQTNVLEPTRKGINLSLDEVSTLIDLLSKVEEMKAKGEV